MIQVIHRFVSELRKAGVRVSPSEAIDAARAAQAVGVESRDLFRLALRATLAKTCDDVALFDRAFQRFFTAPSPPKEGGRRGRGTAGVAPGAARSRPKPPQDRDDEQTPPGSVRGHPDPRRRRPGRLRVILHQTHSERAGVRSGQSPPKAPTGRRDSPARRAPSMARRRPKPLPAVREGGSQATDPRRIDLSRTSLPRSEEEALAREVPRLVREIRLRAGRRSRSGRTGRLWSGHLMRKNVGTGGVPFVLPFRRRRPRRPRVILLADVSWSVMRASALFLMMAEQFLRVHRRRASIYLFVDRCVEAGEALSRWRRADTSTFAHLLESLKDLDPRASSDYGRAFYQAARSRHGLLRQGPLGPSRRDTILVVLGDARSNLRDPQEWAFEELAARCRRVIWLNPEPAARWNTGDSVLDVYLPYCDLICEARDLEGIARGVREILKN